jgi:hypothetical protein
VSNGGQSSGRSSPKYLMPTGAEDEEPPLLGLVACAPPAPLLLGDPAVDKDGKHVNNEL